MKIALFASAFHPSLGGVEELVRQLAHALRRNGDDAIVVTQRWPRDLPAIEEYDGLQVYRFPFREKSDQGQMKERLRTNANYLLTTKSIRREIDALMVSEKIDLVHVQCVSANAIYAEATARQLKLPYVVTLQGELNMDATQLYQRSELARTMMRSALESADAITGCSQQTVEEAEEFFGSPFGSRGRTVYNGIRLSDFEATAPHAHPRPYILGIGRHVEQKGFDVLLRAYAQMRSELGSDNTAPDLILAGDGERHNEFKALAKELGVEAQVHFPGRVDRPKAVALFKGCEFFVLPSRHEPMGIVNLEAMAAGKAVVASRVGGVPELVSEGENGLLVPPDDFRALAAQLLRLVKEPKLSQQLGMGGAKRVQQFDWDVIAKQYQQVYADAKVHAKGRVGG